MTKIEEIDRVISDFLTKTLRVENDKVKIIKTSKDNSVWDAEAEVYEESSFIKALGLPTKVQDRNIYRVKVDNNLDVLFFEKQGQRQDRGES